MVKRKSSLRRGKGKWAARAGQLYRVDGETTSVYRLVWRTIAIHGGIHEQDMNPDQTIIIIAGPNGAGKTTFAREFLPQEANCLTFINADLIAQGISPFRPEEAAVRAARLMLEMIADCVKRGESFAIETTLSGRTYARMIPQWKQAGYQVVLFFLELPSEDLAVARVADRVAQGGHDIPELVIRRRFHGGSANFHALYKPLVDAWKLYDNSGEKPVLINSNNLA